VDVIEFLTGFFAGTLGRKSTHGQYSIYKNNLLTGEEFSSNILMRDPVKVGEAEDPVWVGSYFGDEVALCNTQNMPRDWSRSYLHTENKRGVYCGNLRHLWTSHDVTEAGLVDVDGTGAVIEFEGVDYIMYEFPHKPVLASAWLNQDVRGLRRIMRLEERCGSVQEGKAMVVGDIEDNSVMVYSGILTPTDVDYDFKESKERASCPHPAGYALPSEWWPQVGTKISLKSRYGSSNDPDKVMLQASIKRYNDAVEAWKTSTEMGYAGRYGFDHWNRWDNHNSHPVEYGDGASGFGCLLTDDCERPTPLTDIAVKFNDKARFLPNVHKGWWIGRHIAATCV